MEFALPALRPLGLPARETCLLSKSLPKPRYKRPPSEADAFERHVSIYLSDI
jgi:hypothetical protein